LRYWRTNNCGDEDGRKKVEKSIFNGAKWPGEAQLGEGGGFVSLGRFGGIQMG